MTDIPPTDPGTPPSEEKPPPEGELPPEGPGEPEGPGWEVPETLPHSVIVQDNVSTEGVQTTQQIAPDGSVHYESATEPPEPTSEQTARAEAEAAEAKELEEAAARKG